MHASYWRCMESFIFSCAAECRIRERTSLSSKTAHKIGVQGLRWFRLKLEPICASLPYPKEKRLHAQQNHTVAHPKSQSQRALERCHASHKLRPIAQAPEDVLTMPARRPFQAILGQSGMSKIIIIIIIIIIMIAIIKVIIIILILIIIIRIRQMSSSSV